MENMSEKKPQRIAKVIARAGLCSRREAENWIRDGRVQLNGNILLSPAQTVQESDSILVDGKKLPLSEKSRLFIYHKPAGLVTTNKDEKGRLTIFDRLPKELPRLVTIGRLDINTEGLLLLTNDGELARHLELPSTGWRRRYRVRAHGVTTQEKLDTLRKGVDWKGISYGPIQAQLEKQQGSNAWINISLQEGKNREVKYVMESLGMEVNRLIRTAYGPFQLGRMPKSMVKEIKEKILHEQIKGFFDS